MIFDEDLIDKMLGLSFFQTFVNVARFMLQNTDNNFKRLLFCSPNWSFYVLAWDSLEERYYLYFTTGRLVDLKEFGINLIFSQFILSIG